MGKRKELKEAGGSQDKQESSSDEDFNVLDVEFEWFDPQPEFDFQGIKTLLRQLFDSDAQLFDLSSLTDLILSQPLLGSTVKVEGNESDPFAFLTVLNLHQHRNHQAIAELIQYILDKSAGSSMQANISEMLSPSTEAQIGLILTERFVNMPPQVAPPMYSMLLEEISWALEAKEPYAFSHYLILSKTYREVESQLDLEDERPSKKKRKNGHEPEVFFFHTEDEVLQQHASASLHFEYTNKGDEGASDSKRAFQETGIRPQGLFMLIPSASFETAVKALAEYLKT